MTTSALDEINFIDKPLIMAIKNKLNKLVITNKKEKNSETISLALKTIHQEYVKDIEEKLKFLSPEVLNQKIIELEKQIYDAYHYLKNCKESWTQEIALLIDYNNELWTREIHKHYKTELRTYSRDIKKANDKDEKKRITENIKNQLINRAREIKIPRDMKQYNKEKYQDGLIKAIENFGDRDE